MVDRAWNDQPRSAEDLQTNKPDLVVTHQPPQPGYRFLPATEGTTLSRIGRNLSAQDADGEFIGLAMFSETGAQLLRQTYHGVRERFHTSRFHEAISIQRAAFTDMLQELVNHDHQVACVDIYKGWLEIDTFEDYRRAWAKNEIVAEKDNGRWGLLSNRLIAWCRTNTRFLSRKNRAGV